jgi:hypothetical protein
VGELQDELGEALDAEMALDGFRQIRVSLTPSTTGEITPTPHINAAHQDKYDNSTYENPGYGLQMPTDNTKWVLRVPYTSLQKAAENIGTTLDRVIDKDTEYYVMEAYPGSFWKRYIVGSQRDSNNVRAILMLALPNQ